MYRLYNNNNNDKILINHGHNRESVKFPFSANILCGWWTVKCVTKTNYNNLCPTQLANSTGNFQKLIIVCRLPLNEFGCFRNRVREERRYLLTNRSLFSRCTTYSNIRYLLMIDGQRNTISGDRWNNFIE